MESRSETQNGDMTDLISKGKGSSQMMKEKPNLSEGLKEIVNEHAHPITRKQLLYLAEKRGLSNVGDLEQRDLWEMADWDLPLNSLTDVDWHEHKPQTFSSMKEALLTAAKSYRGSVWNIQGNGVEIWVEKGSIARVIEDITNKFGVRIRVTGYLRPPVFMDQLRDDPPPLSKVYWLGDHWPFDPRDALSTLDCYLESHSVDFERLAVTSDQIEMWNLPTEEIDSIEPKILRALVTNCINRHIDQRVLKKLREEEEKERKAVESLLSQME